MGRYPCGVCSRDVGVNSILCISCNKWCHKRCSGLGRLDPAVNFRCTTRVGGVVMGGWGEAGVVAEGDVVGVVTQFCYFSDVLESEGGAERAVRTRVAAAWGKWREILGLLLNKSIPLARRGMVFDACIRSVMLHGGETWWVLTKRLEAS